MTAATGLIPPIATPLQDGKLDIESLDRMLEDIGPRARIPHTWEITGPQMAPGSAGSFAPIDSIVVAATCTASSYRFRGTSSRVVMAQPWPAWIIAVNAVAPAAEQLKKMLVLMDCGTPRIFEENKFKYVFRSAAHGGMDNIAMARYLVKQGLKVADVGVTDTACSDFMGGIAVCANRGDGITAGGDSGGPMFATAPDGSYVQVGVASTSDRQSFTAYGNVTQYRDWIAGIAGV